LNLDLVDGLDCINSDSQCSLPSLFSGCGVTDQGKVLKETRSIIVVGMRNHKNRQKMHEM